jgi:hypothetical protein
MRLTVLDRLALGRAESFSVGAAPRLVRIALRERSAAVWFNGWTRHSGDAQFFNANSFARAAVASLLLEP